MSTLGNTGISRSGFSGTYTGGHASILQAPIGHLVGLSVLFFIAFFNHADLSTENDEVGLDVQVLLKLLALAVGGLFGFIGFVLDPRVRKVTLSGPMLWVVGIVMLFFASVSVSVMQTESLASSISIACVSLLTITALVRIGVRPVLVALFWAMALFVACSFLVYFAVPEIGILMEPLPGGEFQERMSGLSHANTLGQFSGLTIILGFLLIHHFKLPKLLISIVMFMALIALVMSLSRTSIVATAFSLGVYFRTVLFRHRLAPVFVLVAFFAVLTAGVVFLNMDVESALSQNAEVLSKSGDVDELTSGTGRAEIWAYTIKLISERPLLGYGAATSKEYLADYSLYTHNLILNVALSAGVLAGAMALLMYLGRVFSLFRSLHPIADPLVAFILLNGITENVIFSILAGFPMICWVIALTVRQVESVNEEYEDPNRLLKRSRVIYSFGGTPQ